MEIDFTKYIDGLPFVLKNSQVHIIGMSQKGVTRRENQDRFFVRVLSDGSILAAVADGMGGEAGGDVAAGIAVSSFEQIQSIAQSKELKVLKKIFEKSDREVFQAAQKKPDLEDMGTTLTAIFIRDRKVYWVHVGDSRFFLFRRSGLKQITRDQTFARFLLEEGEITIEQLGTHYSRHILDQCVGHCECEPEFGSFGLEQNDQLLLSTDGLHKSLDLQNMEDILNSEDRIERKPEKLIRKTIKAGGNDDITVLILDLHNCIK
ncbi:MAG: serine/threonine-protein phosphatase [Desulfobacteraceae bacterium]|nr:serine/threonine-protein phosphatase [Desulfobacteraceae bacterium]